MDACARHKRLRRLDNVQSGSFGSDESLRGVRETRESVSTGQRPLHFKLPRNREARSLIIAQNRLESSLGSVQVSRKDLSSASALQHGRYTLRRNRGRVRYADQQSSSEEVASSSNESSRVEMKYARTKRSRRTMRKWSQGFSEPQTRRRRATWNSSDSSYEPQESGRRTGRRKARDSSDLIDNECTSSEEVNAMFAEAEEKELAEEEELEKQMEREHIVVSSSDGSSQESDDPEDDDFKYLEPRRSRLRARHTMILAKPALSASGAEACREPPSVERGTKGGSNKTIRELNTRTERAFGVNPLLRSFSRSRPVDLDSDSDAVDLDEHTWGERERRRLISSKNSIQPVNMELGGTTSGSLAGRSPFRGASSENTGKAAVEPVKIDPTLSWEQIGGLDDYIRALKEMIVLPLLYPEVFEQFKLEPPKGVLFHGPPGTGKTLMARVLAAACAAGTRTPVAFFMRNGADCLSKWVGEAERQLRLTFEAAKSHQPAIIFFDEIDGLAPVRSSKQDQIHSSIVSTLLGLMDGLDARGQIIVIGATNRIDAVDPALRRPGRFDREFVFSLPNTAARRRILEIHTRDWMEPPPRELLDSLAKHTAGYCGADLKALCSEAALYALRRRYPQIYNSVEKLLIDPRRVQVGESDFISAMSMVVPTAHRSLRVFGRPLDKEQSILLGQELEMIVQRTREMSMRSLSGKGGRLLIYGAPGNGQTILGQALLHEMEDRVLYTMDLPSLVADASARTPEEALVTTFREALRCPAAVMYIPHLELWAGQHREFLRSLLLVNLRDLHRDSPLFVFATAETDRDLLLATQESASLTRCDDEVEPDLAEICEFFVAESDAAYFVGSPPEHARRRLFEPLIQQAASPPSCEADSREAATVDPQVLEELPRAPIPNSPKANPREKDRLIQREERTLRELRLLMRDFVERLLSDRKYKPFWKRVSSSEAPDYYELVKDPIDLSTILDRVNAQEIQTMHDLVAAFELLAQNALQYNPADDEKGMRIRSKATALLDIVHRWADLLMDPEENEEESTIIAECAAIVERRKHERRILQLQRRHTRSLGSDGVLSISEAAHLVSQSRKHHRIHERASDTLHGSLQHEQNGPMHASQKNFEDIETQPNAYLSSMDNAHSHINGSATEFAPCLPQSEGTSSTCFPHDVQCSPLRDGFATSEMATPAALIVTHDTGLSAGDRSSTPEVQEQTLKGVPSDSPRIVDISSKELMQEIAHIDSEITNSATGALHDGKRPDTQPTANQMLSPYIRPPDSMLLDTLETIIATSAGLSAEELIRLYEHLAHCVRHKHARTGDRIAVLSELRDMAARSRAPVDALREPSP